LNDHRIIEENREVKKLPGPNENSLPMLLGYSNHSSEREI
jgi:hypothetical protein